MRHSVSRLTITLGYVAMLALLLGALLFINQQVERLTESDDAGEQWTDSLLGLLKAKDENAIQLLHTMREQAQEGMLSAEMLEEVIARQDSVAEQQRVTHRIVTRRDTVISRPKRKGFFRRLGEVFVPSRRDSTIEVQTSQEVAVDTLIEAYNPADSLHRRLLEMAHAKQASNDKHAWRKDRLQRFDRQLSAQIDSLLKHHELQTLQRFTAEAEERRLMRLQSVRTISFLAIGALLLAGIFLAIIFRDVARSNRYRRQLEEAQRQMADLLATREQLMLAITHDFKAPLGSIIGYTDLLSQSALSDRQMDYLQNMKASSKHLLSLVSNLLDFHRLDLHKVSAEYAVFVPAQLFREVALSFRPLAAARGLGLEVEISPSLDANFISDAERLRQIVNNLLSNALKFTEHGSVSLRVSIHDGSQLLLSVADTGCGMTDSEQTRLFKAFSRLSGAQGREGFGLGLSIVHKLVDLLEGTISVSSKYGEGSCFTVCLPLPKGPQLKTDESIDTESPASKPICVPLRLLLIDDDVIQLQLMTAMLAKRGIEALSCRNVDELLDALRTSSYDLLLTDVQMPAISGFDLLTLLRSSNISQAKTIPVIAVTARGRIYADDYVQHGFLGVIGKPFSVDEMLACYHGECNVSRESNNKEIDTECLTVNVPLSDIDKILSLAYAEGLHYDALTAFSEGDDDASATIMNSFREERDKSITKLRAALLSQDTATVSAIAHKMIPIYTLIGADAFVRYLKEWEQS